MFIMKQYLKKSLQIYNFAKTTENITTTPVEQTYIDSTLTYSKKPEIINTHDILKNRLSP